MTPRAAGSLRQRRPGVWEVRVYLGDDPLSGQPTQRSVTVRGELADAEQRRALLAAQAQQLRDRRERPLRSTADLLEVWLAAEHNWKPATWQNYRLAVRRLTADPVCRQLPDRLSPPVLRTAMRAWQQGVPLTTIALHVRTLKAALGWAFDERLIASPPLQGKHGPSPCAPRRDVPLDVVRELLSAAEQDVAHAAALPASVHHDRQLHTAEQIQLLLRLAADTGARRGELDALQSGDLHGQVLHIDRGVSAEIVTTTKTGRSRRITLGADTVQLWHRTHDARQDRLRADQRLGPWMFSPRPGHQQRLLSGTLGHWFTAFVRRHDHPDVCLHRLRHTVATVLVADGKLLQAQQRLGHAEASTTLRQYCHALPLHDQDVADQLNALLQHPPPPT